MQCLHGLHCRQWPRSASRPRPVPITNHTPPPTGHLFPNSVHYPGKPCNPTTNAPRPPHPALPSPPRSPLLQLLALLPATLPPTPPPPAPLPLRHFDLPRPNPPARTSVPGQPVKPHPAHPRIQVSPSLPLPRPPAHPPLPKPRRHTPKNPPNRTLASARVPLGPGRWRACVPPYSTPAEAQNPSPSPQPNPIPYPVAPPVTLATSPPNTCYRTAIRSQPEHTTNAPRRASRVF